MLDDVVTILNAESSITDKVGSRIYIENAPQGAALPHIILSVIDGEVHDSKSTVSELDYPIMQVQVFDQIFYTKGSITGAYDILKLVRTALDVKEFSAYGLFFRAQDVPQTVDLSIPNRPLKMAEMEFIVEQIRT